jgi:hypothetical protein
MRTRLDCSLERSRRNRSASPRNSATKLVQLSICWAQSLASAGYRQSVAAIAELTPSPKSACSPFRLLSHSVTALAERASRPRSESRNRRVVDPERFRNCSSGTARTNSCQANRTAGLAMFSAVRCVVAGREDAVPEALKSWRRVIVHPGHRFGNSVMSTDSTRPDSLVWTLSRNSFQAERSPLFANQRLHSLTHSVALRSGRG